MAENLFADQLPKSQDDNSSALRKTQISLGTAAETRQ